MTVLGLTLLEWVAINLAVYIAIAVLLQLQFQRR